MAINAASTYQNNAIKTASPAELTLSLYEGAIKFSNMALMAIESSDTEKCHINIVKSRKYYYGAALYSGS